jgi:hypothetical protein
MGVTSSVLAKKVRENWNKVMWFIVYDQVNVLPRALQHIAITKAASDLSCVPAQLVLSVIIGGFVGLGFGFVATLGLIPSLALHVFAKSCLQVSLMVEP